MSPRMGSIIGAALMLSQNAKQTDDEEPPRTIVMEHGTTALLVIRPGVNIRLLIRILQGRSSGTDGRIFDAELVFFNGIG